MGDHVKQKFEMGARFLLCYSENDQINWEALKSGAWSVSKARKWPNSANLGLWNRARWRLSAAGAVRRVCGCAECQRGHPRRLPTVRHCPGMPSLGDAGHMLQGHRVWGLPSGQPAEGPLLHPRQGGFGCEPRRGFPPHAPRAGIADFDFIPPLRGWWNKGGRESGSLHGVSQSEPPADRPHCKPQPLPPRPALVPGEGILGLWTPNLTSIHGVGVSLST